MADEAFPCFPAHGHLVRTCSPECLGRLIGRSPPDAKIVSCCLDLLSTRDQTYSLRSTVSRLHIIKCDTAIISQDQWLAYALDSDDSCESEQAASLMLLQTSRCSARQWPQFQRPPSLLDCQKI